MVGKRRSFTVKASSLLRQLVTPCFVSRASKHVSTASRPPSMHCRSLWDTGATLSMVTRRVVENLALQPEGYMNLGHAGGDVSGVPFYHVDLLLYNNAPIANVRVGLVEVKDIDVIIGMDIINRGDFAVSNRNGATSFSFRIPSVEDFDFASADNRPSSSLGEHEPN